jgi:NAD-dependent deacetylase
MMQDVAALVALISASRRMVIFTGAGMSTESGIPDFRSTGGIQGGGIWTKMMPVEFQDYISDPGARRVSWQRRFEMEDTWNAVQPNDGHRAVAELVARGKASHVITQNIDALHQAALEQIGIMTDTQVIELHGNTRYAKCLDCGMRVEISDIRTHFDTHGEAPDCAACGGIVKTATISFGQPMPQDEMTRAEAASLACDLMLVLGSSRAVVDAL